MSSSVISNCLRPIPIADRVKGGYMYVNCGKCDNCRSSYRSSWQSRLDDEASNSAATLFFTLTYSNEHVPKLTWDESEPNILYSNRSANDHVYLDDYNANFKFRPLLQNYHHDKTTIGYCSKSDIQKFFKRLRRLLEYDSLKILVDVPQEARLFRYFVTSEYGPQTFRPHYHGLLYFNDVRVADAVEKFYILKAWGLCDSKNLDCSRVVSSASSYVSKYVNSWTKLPDILKIPSKTSSFFLCSRRPAIGVSFFDYDQLASKVKYGNVKRSKLVNVNGVSTVVELPLHSSVIRYYFPKLYRSSDYDNSKLRDFFFSVFRYVSKDAILQLRYLPYRDQYDYISSLLPSYIRDIILHLDSLSVQANRRIVMGDIYSTLTNEEVLFGIPQNRTALIRFLIYSSNTGFNISEYVNIYCSFYSLRFSDTINYSIECQNDLISKGYSQVDVARFVYPSFFKSLPSTLDVVICNKDFRLFDQSTDYYINLSMLLSGLGLTIEQVYPNGKLDLRFVDINNDYLNTAEFKMHCDKIKDKDVQFEKTRLTNHFINQNNQNYESF